MRRPAFTLIELLVVIAIISLLLGILMPSLTRARAMAKELQCQTNQRAVGMAIQSYANELGGTLPGSETWFEDVLSNLDGSLPYDPLNYRRENVPPVLFCPCDPDPYPRPYMTGEMELTSYFVNGAETDFAMGSGDEIKLGLFGGGDDSCLDTIVSPAACMMLGETSNYGKVADLDHEAAQSALDAVGADLTSARKSFHHRATSGFYHDSKMCVYFVDGHGAVVQGKKVEPLEPSLWPSGVLMDGLTAFYPGLSLPTATEAPTFWGPPYTD